MAAAEKILMLEPAANSAGRNRWVYAVEALVAEVSEWSESEDWDVLVRGRKSDRDLSYEEHSLPVIEIDAHPQDARSGRDVKLILEPMTYNPATKIGRVDFYVWPAMYRVRLLKGAHDVEWRVKTDSGIYWPMPWNKETFEYIAAGLLAT